MSEQHLRANYFTFTLTEHCLSLADVTANVGWFILVNKFFDTFL